MDDMTMRVGLQTCLFLFAAALPADAQEAVLLTARVVSDGSAVAGAEVTAGETRAVTGANGEAVLRVAAGAWTIRVAAFGFGAAEREVVVTRDTTIVFELEHEAVEEEEILVLSTRGERRIEDEPIRVEMIGQEEVEEKMLMTPGSIAMLLNETTGLRVQETSPSLGGAGIRIQGLRGRYTQLLADGLPLYGGSAGALGLLQIPPMDLRQVEVIKGAASALYGASALGGVVNLISKRPARERELLLNATTRAGGDALLWLADDHDGWGYTFLGGVHGQRRADVEDDGWANLPSYERVTLRPRLFWERGRARGVVTLGAMLEDREGGGTLPTGADYVQSLVTRRFDGGAGGQVLLSESLLLDYRLSAAWIGHDHAFDDLRERDHHTTGFAEASLRGQSGAHLWAAGVALQRDGYDGRDVEGFDYAWWTPAVFAQDEVALGDRVTLAASARFDHHSEYGAFLSPRASLLVRPSEATSIRASAGTGFFAPTPFTEETEEVGLGRVEPLEDLEAERAWGASVDVGAVVRGIEANFTVFASRIEDAVATVQTVDDRARLLNVDGPTRTAGTETLLRYRREPWGLTLSHTYVHATEPVPEGEGRRRVPLMPRHLAGLVGVYERHGEGRIGIEMYFTGQQSLDDDPYRDTSRAYVVLGVLAEKRFGAVRAFVNLENLTDARQTRWAPVVRPDVGPYGRWTTDAWAPLEGRVINGGIRVSF